MTSVIQSKSSGWVTGGLPITLVLDSTPASGNRLIAFQWAEGATSCSITTAGWSALESLGTNGNALELWTAYGSAGDTIVTPSTPGSINHCLIVYEIDDDIDVHGQIVNGNFPSSGIGTIAGPTLTPAGDVGIELVGLIGSNQTYVPVATFTAVSPLTAFGSAVRYGRVHAWSADGPTTTGSYTPSATVTGLTDQKPTAGVAVILGHTTPASPVADFTADKTFGPEQLLVTFTDLSTNTPTSWAWDFGDGGTSTSQNPAHTFAGSGFYTVSLTATNAFGSDTETKTAYIHVVSNTALPPQSPAKALVEIYTDEAGAYRWDDATWDDAIWATSAWRDITPESIDVVIRWGSSRPELGILAQPDAESWALDIYDPDRSLDPANVDGPYYGSLKPGLPIRINHGTNPLLGFTIRTGIVESMGHDFTDPGTGYIRVTNDQSTYANAAVPHDTTLSDTLFARARDAIAAAGLPVRVLADPSTGDPDLVAWADTGSDQTVWDWIADAAQSVLWIPYFDRNGWLGFRKYGTGYSRALQLAAPEMVNLLSVSQYNGNYSRIQVHDSADVEVVRYAATDYGKRTFTRTNLTPDAAAWAEAVLADRAFDSLWWQPGTVHPFTGDRVKLHAATTAVEVVDISHTYTDPAIDVSVIVLGGEIRITAMADDEAIWEFVYHTSQSVPTPLAVTGTTNPVEYLVRTGGGDAEYLFPSL